MPADRFGNRLQAARNLGSLAAPVSIQDGLNGRDQNDVARFQLSSRSTLTLQVSGVRRGNAVGVDLFTPKSTSGKAWQRLSQTDLGRLKAKDLGQNVNFLSRSRATASSPSSVSLTLNAGEYYLRLYSRKNSTPYQLFASATPLNAPTQPTTPPSSSQPQTPPNSLPPASQPSVPQGLSQTWLRQFGTSANDYAYGVAVNGEQLSVSGSTNGSLGSTNAGDRDSFVAQLSTQGSPPVVRQFGQSGTDIAADVVTDSAGNYYVSGVDIVTAGVPVLGGSSQNPNGYIAKYSPNGMVLWRRSIETTTTLGQSFATIPAADAVSRIAIDAQGNVYVTGFVEGFPDVFGSAFSRPSQAFAAKYDSSGAEQWIKKVNLSGSSGGTDIALDGQGNVYLSGVTNARLTINPDDPLTNGDPFVAKLNASGDTLWQQTIEAPGTNLARGVAVDRGGNVYITGDTSAALPGQTSAGGTDAFLAKYSSSGDRQWLKQFGSAQFDQSQAMAIDNQDRVYLTGETTGSLFGNAPIGLSDPWLGVFDSAGTLLGSTQFGTPQNDEAYGLAVVSPAPGALPNSPYTVYLVGQTQGTFPNSGITNNQGSYDAWAAQYSLSPV